MEDAAAGPLTVHAPAKINLALHVTGRRPDNYHLIDTLAVFTRFGDRLTVAPAEEDRFTVTGAFAGQVPQDESNLILRARDALRQAVAKFALSHSFAPPSVLPAISPPRGEITFGLLLSSICKVARRSPRLELPIPPLVGAGRTKGGVKERNLNIRNIQLPPVAITLEKNLPVASGLGGGSSDAAAALRALAALWRLEIGEAELASIGLELGADVPMCLAATPLIARGIGDVVSPVPGFPALGLVLVNPGGAVSTAEVFGALKARDNEALPPLPRKLDFHTLCNWLEGTRNDLEPAARAIEPGIGAALAALGKADAHFARMSGSGASCFGLFETGNVAKRAAAAIRARHPGWFVAATRNTASEAA